MHNLRATYFLKHVSVECITKNWECVQRVPMRVVHWDYREQYNSIENILTMHKCFWNTMYMSGTVLPDWLAHGIYIKMTLLTDINKYINRS